ncbi:T9SS type B sorting domain-containing protein [Hymenobacter actinosclerus]|uniref:Gliding motility-associated C-terminal domain-containing protein n=1 Tax=Hymenobacter actinosclerus TaxID=82805 RepID=A0A1I0FI95_9BACT|nr:gliding motility-associated C-terminal domain-containing protein [Hymenobacter actinosclerus]SET57698.1 gliding motility-associated C-terminal domain-containing protein [Hymenobacter actinosclerus]
MRTALLIRPLQRWLTGLLLLLVCLLAAPAARATHLAAGDIQARTDPNNPRHIFFTLSLYVGVPGPEVAEEPTVIIFFGDNTSQEGIPFVSQTRVAPEYLLNVYKFEHIYNSTGPFTVGYASVNRPRGVVNMANSANESFYISTTILINAFIQNNSPQLLAPAIDKGSVGQVFLHNPAAYDVEGDSLAYELMVSQKAGDPRVAIASGNKLNPVPTTGFTYPNNLPGVDARQVLYSGPPAGVPGDRAIFSIDARTGQIVWNAPAQTGTYNVAFKVKEYRRTPGKPTQPTLLSETIRDMQIIVKAQDNRRPIITVPPDVCVVANTAVPGGTITATDPDGNPVLLEAFTGLLPTPASFRQSTKGPPVARALFQWTPTCSYIRRQPYSVLFKATDEPVGSISPLIDQRTWNITVVGPAPQNLQATPQGNNMRLDWDSYSCQNPGAQILIFRRENCFAFTPTTCETGLPAGSGYVQIGTVGVGSRTFLDDNNGAGLTRGKTYSYRIYVRFAQPGGGESLASNEACVKVEGRSPRLTNVTVDRTDVATGQITVRWNQPAPLANFREPRGYRLYRATGLNPAATDFRKVYSTTNLLDTTFVNTGLNTEANAYTYRLDFFSNTTLAADSVERTQPASSVRLTTTPNPLANTVAVSWTYNVPWDNSKRPSTVYRREPGGTFRPVGKAASTATGGQFVDDGKVLPLVKNRTYCYYVKTNGTYDIALPDSLINLSQEQCAPLRAVPCTPVLTLKPTNCDSLASRLFDLPTTPKSGMVFTNYLSWTLSNLPTEDCSRDIVEYIIYFAPNAQAELTELARVPGTQTTYQHANLTTAQGCYAVQAVDRNGAVSALSNKECKDNCLLFLLPNIFTPNADGKNDTFRPKVFSPIERTAIKIYNRWGTKVYESDQDPLINWNGGGKGEGNSNGKVSDGVYFYQAEVTFRDANRTTRTFKGWVQINR